MKYYDAEIKLSILADCEESAKRQARLLLHLAKSQGCGFGVPRRWNPFAGWWQYTMMAVVVDKLHDIGKDMMDLSRKYWEQISEHELADAEERKLDEHIVITQKGSEL
jgi:hypothetical protein